MTDIEDMTISEASAPGAIMTPEEKAEALRKRREIPLPALPGAFFVYGLGGMGKLEDALLAIDPSVYERQGTVFAHIERHLLAGNPKMVRAAIDIGLKRKDAEGQNVAYTGLDFDDLPFTVGEAVEAALPAICVAMTGSTYAELIAEATAAHKAAMAEAQEDGGAA
jgi:hypothetical protein